MVHLSAGFYKKRLPMPATTPNVKLLTDEVLARCETIAGFSEAPGQITRTYLCEAMHPVHDCVDGWMRAAGMAVRIDAIGNVVGRYSARQDAAPLLLFGSHLDTVPNAGKYDGVLGVLLGIAAVQALGGERLPFGVGVLAFAEEEGIRFRTSYLGSRAVCGRLDPRHLDQTDVDGTTLEQAIRRFGLNPEEVPQAAITRDKILGYVEAHIEQGPILEGRDLSLGVVDAIVGLSRLWFKFEGKAGHAGTLPMEMRKDALASAAEFVVRVEEYARSVPGLRATVGKLDVLPGAVNVVPGEVRLSLDVRHAEDAVRQQALQVLLERSAEVAERRGVRCRMELGENHAAVPADPRLTDRLAEAARAIGHEPLRMVSGAGHDAAVMAGIAPMAMLFIRSPGGISHHPDESVRASDVQAALATLVSLLHNLAGETR